MKHGVELLNSNKPIYILNATPIIHFSKIGRLNQILDICNAFIAKEIYIETVIKGDKYPDSLLIKKAVESGTLKVYEIKMQNEIKSLLKYPEIHRGEAETIVTAKELKGIAILDDEEARTIAKVFQVKTEPGCLFLLFRLLKLSKIDAIEAKMLLEALIKSGLYLDPEVLLKVYKKIEQI
jgi:predicted nucleic acid-binding protein